MTETLTLPQNEATQLSDTDVSTLVGLVADVEKRVQRAAGQKVYLSIVIPAYNEERRIEATLDRAVEYLRDRGYSSEIIIVDDGSTDGTIEVGRRILDGRGNYRILANSQNEGKGSAIRKGMLAAQGEYVLFMDADMSTPIEELDRLLPYLYQGHDIVIGSRKIPGSKIDVHQPRYREIMGEMFSRLSRVLTVRSVHDFTCGFKCFSKSCIQKIFKRQRLTGWGYDSEILFIAQKHGFRIKEVPVMWSDSADSKVRLWKDVVCSAFDLISVRVNNLLRRYR